MSVQLFSDGTSAGGAMGGARGQGAWFRVAEWMVRLAGLRSPNEGTEEPALLVLVQTSAGGVAAEETHAEQSPGTAIMELRRLSGLTWDHLARLLGVTRRSLHFWASGHPASAKNEERLYRVLAAVRRADRGGASKNRAMLFDERDGVVPFDLLERGEYDRFLAVVGPGSGRRQATPKPLSAEARSTRKPPPPEMLVGALQERVHKDKGRLLSSTPIGPHREE